MDTIYLTALESGRADVPKYGKRVKTLLDKLPKMGKKITYRRVDYIVSSITSPK